MKLLVVDDDDVISHCLRTYLSQRGYVVDRAIAAQEAIGYLEVTRYDLILLDISLPDGSGIDFCQTLRQRGIDALIILMTANSRSNQVEGLNAGADDYLIKPFALDDLEARIKALLRRNRTVQHQVRTWGDLRIDVESNQTTFRQQSLELTAREKSLILLFLQDPERIHSQRNLLHALWSLDDDLPGEEAVRTMMRRLRKKFAAIGAEDLIETVYGLGYRLNPALGEAAPEPNPLIPATNISHATIKQHGLTLSEIQARLLADMQVIQGLSQTSSSQDYQQAQRMAQRLIGSLGILKLPAGVTIAQQLDEHLRTRSPSAIDLNWVIAESQRLQPMLTAINQSAIALQNSSQTTHIAANQMRDRGLEDLRILVLDDDQVILKLLQGMLSPWGLAVTTFSQAEQLLTQLTAVQPDILILDLNLPDGNGIELCQMLRADPQWTDLAIIILTGQRNSDVIQRVFDAGADDFVSKPIVPPEFMARLLNRIERIRSRQGGSQRDALTQLYNQQAGHNRLNHAIQQSLPNEFCIALIQIHGLTDLMQQQGIAARDRYLQAIAKQLKQMLPDAILSRWQGGEFVIGATIQIGHMTQICQQLQRHLPALIHTETSVIRVTWSTIAATDSSQDLATLLQCL